MIEAHGRLWSDGEPSGVLSSLRLLRLLTGAVWLRRLRTFGPAG